MITNEHVLYLDNSNKIYKYIKYFSEGKILIIPEIYCKHYSKALNEYLSFTKLKS